MKFQQLVKIAILGASSIAMTGCQTLTECAQSTSFWKGLSDGFSTGLNIGMSSSGGSNATNNAATLLTASAATGSGYAAPQRQPMASFASTTSAANPLAKSTQPGCWRAIVHHPWAGGGLNEETFETKADAESAVAMGRRTYGGPASDVHLIGPCR